MPAWLVFALSALAVAGAGVQLARAGDVLAEGTRLGGMWMGAIVLAAATSLPELTTGINAVAQGEPNLAAGDLFGACAANMMLLALADLAVRGPRVLVRVTVNQALVGALGICLASVAAIGILTTHDIAIGPISASTLVIALVYAAGMRLIHVNRGAPPFASEAELEQRHVDRAMLRRAVVGFVAAAIVILVAAPLLTRSTAELADQLGMSHGLAGMLFLALTTTLPEASVTVGSVRVGAYSMAVGNLFGSNCFNLATFVLLDIVHGPTALLSAIDPSMALAALFASLLMALAIVEVLNKSEARLWRVEPGPTFMLLAYLVGLLAVYAAGGGH